MTSTLRLALILALSLILAPGLGRTADAKDAPQAAIDKGLAWLAKQQQKDGHWEAAGGNYKVAMTAYAGLALLAEGSAPGKGKYGANLHKAADWLQGQAQPDGLIGKDPSEAGRYIMGHANAVLFLSQAYLKETDADRVRKLGKVLDKALQFLDDAKTTRGGWGYVSAKDGSDFDEGCATAMVLHALFASRKAGLNLPRGLVQSTMLYLKNSTTVVRKDDDGKKTESGVIYSLAARGAGDARPALTAASIAALLEAGEEQSDLALPWLNYVQVVIPVGLDQRFGHDLFIHYYYAQACNALGDKLHAKLRPDLAGKADRLLTWGRYRKANFAKIAEAQKGDGSWGDQTIGPIYATAMYLAILQMDRGNVPYYKR
jgi:hypothetical protein